MCQAMDDVQDKKLARGARLGVAARAKHEACQRQVEMSYFLPSRNVRFWGRV